MSAFVEQGPPMLVIGVGSPHGDDRAGWEVIDQLVEELATEAASEKVPSFQLHKAAVPHDILDWLTSEAIVHIIDASVDVAPDVRCYLVTGELGELRIKEVLPNGPNELQFDRLPISSVCAVQLRSNSTHQFDLFSSLELALALGKLPKTVILWTISILQSNASAALSNSTQALVHQCVRHIVTTL